MTLADLQPGIPVAETSRPPAPLVPVAVGIAVGITLDSFFQIPIPVSVALLVIAAVLLLGVRHNQSKSFARFAGWLAVALAASGLGALRHALADRWIAQDHVVRHINNTRFNDGILATVRGIILTNPVIQEPDPATPRPYPSPPTTRLIIEANQLIGEASSIPTCGQLAVRARGVRLGLSVGDQVQITGWLRRPAPPRNPGEFDWRAYQKRQGILVSLFCDHGESIRVLDSEQSGGWRAMLSRVRARMRSYLIDHGFEDAEPDAGVISAMVLGERSAVPRHVNEDFVRTGNAHLLAASGMQVAWLGLIGWVVARTLGLHYRKTAILVGGLIISYVLLSDPQPSILRAGIVGLLACIAAFFRGRYSSVNALAFSAILLLTLRPQDLFSPGFQLTYLATIGLLHFCPLVSDAMAKILYRLNLPRIARFFSVSPYGFQLIQPDAARESATSVWQALGTWIAFLIAQLFALSVAEWVLTAPLTCYLFGSFAPWGWMGTFIASAIAMPVTCIGYLTVLCGIIIPSSGVVLGPALSWSTRIMTGRVEQMAGIPYVSVDGRLPSSLAWVLATYAVIGIWCYRREWISGRFRRGYLMLAIVLVCWWLIPPRWVHRDRDALCVWMLAVGNGTGTIIELPDGRVLLYDFGTRSGFDAAPTAVNFLKTRGITAIDAAFVSHTDFDHYSAIPAIADKIPIGRVIINDHFEKFAADEPAAQEFLAAVRKRGTPIETTSGPTRYDEFLPVVVETLWPGKASDRPIFADNDASIVLKLTYEGRSILMPGDIAEAGIAGLLELAPDSSASPSDQSEATDSLRADALALPHHGAVVHNTIEFIEAVNPSVAIRSSGQSQSETTSGIERLVARRAYYNTADDGCVFIKVENGECLATVPMVAKGQSRK